MTLISWKSGAAAALLIALTALVLAGCGSSDSTSSSTAASENESTQEATSTETASADYPAAEFEKLIKETQEPPSKWPGPTSSPKAAPGNPLVFNVPSTKAAEGVNRVTAGLEGAAKALGWRFKSPVNPEGNPEEVAAGIEQGIQEGADVITIIGFESKLAGSAIEKASKAGILVTCVSCGEDPANFSPTFTARETPFNFAHQGEIMAAFVAVDSGGTAKTAVLNDPEFPVVQQRYEKWLQAYPKCTGCEEVDHQDFTAAEIGPPLGEKSQAVLQSNPDAEYLYVGFDGAAEAVAQAMAQPGAAQAKIVSFDGNKANVALVGEGLQYATIAEPVEWTAWAAMDNINRELQNEPPDKSEGSEIPSRLITEENAAEYEDEGYLGDLDFEKKYEELWSTGHTSSAP